MSNLRIRKEPTKHLGKRVIDNYQVTEAGKHQKLYDEYHIGADLELPDVPLDQTFATVEEEPDLDFIYGSERPTSPSIANTNLVDDTEFGEIPDLLLEDLPPVELNEGQIEQFVDLKAIIDKAEKKLDLQVALIETQIEQTEKALPFTMPKRSKSRTRKGTKKSTRGKAKRSTTRKPVAKRRKTGGSRKGVKLPNTSAAEMLANVNPFATSSAAKLPDGGVANSVPLRYRQIAEINCPKVEPADNEAEGANGTTHVVLYPGLCSGVMVSHNMKDKDELIFDQKYSTDFGLEGDLRTMVVDTTTGNSSYGDYEDAIPFLRDSGEDPWKFDNWPAPNASLNDVKNRVPAEGVTYRHLMTGNLKGTLHERGAIAKWRTLSSACRLTLLNTDEQNDGWFEAIRMNERLACNHWELTADGYKMPDTAIGGTIGFGNGGLDGAYVKPNDELIDAIETKNWAENPTYICDKLKNIHKYQFALTPHQPVNMLKEVTNGYEFNVGTLQTADSPVCIGDPSAGLEACKQLKYRSNFTPGDIEATKLIEDVIDFDHDMVCIRIHPGLGSISNTSGDNETISSKLLLDHVCNQEVVYDTDHQLAKFMGRNDSHPVSAKAIMDAKRAQGGLAAMTH